MWLFYLYSTVKIRLLYLVFPLAESIAKAFCWLFLSVLRHEHTVCRLCIEVQIEKQIDLAQDHNTGTVEEIWIFFRLIISFRHTQKGDFGILAAVEFHKADEIFNIFDEQDADFI